MTVSYNLAVSSVGSFTWVKLLFRWRGSIWKSVYQELFVWLFLYYIVSGVYRTEWFLDTEQKENFEKVAYYLNRNIERIPLTFMLGFFVTLVVQRWTQIFNNMGWVENTALTVACLIRGKEPSTVLHRRTIIRYLCLTQVLVFRDISMRVRRRFPSLESIVKAGFLHDTELKMLESIPIPFNKYWAPINWATILVYRMREEGKITSEPSLQNIINEIKAYRTGLHILCNYDWVPVPLAYPQVVFLAVRVYFIICLVSRQFLLGGDEDHRSPIDMYFPVTTSFQFLFFVGWMKVAEALLNPMGEDDDDFECNFLIDKNIATGMAIVDDNYDVAPELRMDAFKEFSPPDLYPESKPEIHELVGSTSYVTIPPARSESRRQSAASNADGGRNVVGSLRHRIPKIPTKLRDIGFRRSNSIHVDSIYKQPDSVEWSLGGPRKSHDVDVTIARPSISKDMAPNKPCSVLSPELVQEVDEEQLTINSLKAFEQVIKKCAEADDDKDQNENTRNKDTTDESGRGKIIPDWDFNVPMVKTSQKDTEKTYEGNTEIIKAQSNAQFKPHNA